MLNYNELEDKLINMNLKDIMVETWEFKDNMIKLNTLFDKYPINDTSIKIKKRIENNSIIQSYKKYFTINSIKSYGFLNSLKIFCMKY